MFDFTEPSATDPLGTPAAARTSPIAVASTTSPTRVLVPWASISEHWAGDSPADAQARSTAMRCPTGLGAVMPLPRPSLAPPMPRSTA